MKQQKNKTNKQAGKNKKKQPVKKPLTSRWWFWVLIVLFLGILSALGK